MSTSGTPQAVIAQAGDNLTLTCQVREEDKEQIRVEDEEKEQDIVWNTTAEAFFPQQSSVTHGKRLELKVMSVTNLHTGFYNCSTRGTTVSIYLFVNGESIVIKPNSSITEPDVTFDMVLDSILLQPPLNHNLNLNLT